MKDVKCLRVKGRELPNMSVSTHSDEAVMTIADVLRGGLRRRNQGAGYILMNEIVHFLAPWRVHDRVRQGDIHTPTCI